MEITHVHLNDDLGAICDKLQADTLGEDNEMPAYTPEALRQFLDSENNVFIIGKVDNTIACVALCYALNHPDRSRSSLYIDELDTHPNYRRKGYASELIVWLKKYAANLGLSEVWLGTEVKDNDAANLFYQSLDPTETVTCNLYSYAPITREKEVR